MVRWFGSRLLVAGVAWGTRRLYEHVHLGVVSIVEGLLVISQASAHGWCDASPVLVNSLFMYRFALPTSALVTIIPRLSPHPFLTRVSSRPSGEKYYRTSCHNTLANPNRQFLQ